MEQLSFTDAEFSNRHKATKRELFLQEMESIIPFDEWVSIIEPHYYSNTKGRKPIAIETMLRMYLLQNWFNLSDEGIEDAIYDSYAMKKFLHIDFSNQQVPDATTLLHFRHMLEDHGLQKAIFDSVKNRLDRAGLLMHGGTIVDATIIKAPSSTKNRTKMRDPEMHSTRKGNQWYFGMKEHIGVDAATGYIHSIVAKSGEGVVHNWADPWPSHQVHTADRYVWTMYSDRKEGSHPRWDAKQFPVDATIVAMGTNDFSKPAKHSPTKEEFVAGYVNLIKTIRAVNPGKKIICTEPVPNWGGKRGRAWVRAAVDQVTAEGMKDVYFIAINDPQPLLAESDYAHDSTHPLQTGHQKIAAYLKDKIAAIMGWN